MAIVSEGDPFFVTGGLPRRHSLIIMLAEGVGKVPVYKIVIGFSDDVCFLGTEKTLEHCIAGEIDAIFVFHPDQVGDSLHQCVCLLYTSRCV